MTLIKDPTRYNIIISLFLLIIYLLANVISYKHSQQEDQLRIAPHPREDRWPWAWLGDDQAEDRTAALQVSPWRHGAENILYEGKWCYNKRNVGNHKPTGGWDWEIKRYHHKPRWVGAVPQELIDDYDGLVWWAEIREGAALEILTAVSA